jgi:hypothetical protein
MRGSRRFVDLRKIAILEPALTCPGERHAPQRLQKPYGLLPPAISHQSQEPPGSVSNNL